MPWIVLIFAGLMEVAWATALVNIRSVADWQPITVWVAAMGLSMIGLAYAMRSIPVGPAYTVWVGIGAVGTVLVAAHRGQSLSPASVVCLLLIVAGIVGLRLTVH